MLLRNAWRDPFSFPLRVWSSQRLQALHLVLAQRALRTRAGHMPKPLKPQVGDSTVPPDGASAEPRESQRHGYSEPEGLRVASGGTWSRIQSRAKADRSSARVSLLTLSLTPRRCPTAVKFGRGWWKEFLPPERGKVFSVAPWSSVHGPMLPVSVQKGNAGDFFTCSFQCPS